MCSTSATGSLERGHGDPWLIKGASDPWDFIIQLNHLCQARIKDYRIQMVLKNWFTGQQWRNRDREQTYGHGERGGEGEMYGKSNMEIYITIYKIDSQREFAVWLRKLKQGLCINLEGWDGEGVEREFQKGGDICLPMADSCWGLTENSKIL